MTLNVVLLNFKAKLCLNNLPTEASNKIDLHLYLNNFRLVK